jgi:hypothetical protein
MNASFIILSSSLYDLNVQHYITQESTKHDSEGLNCKGMDVAGRDGS